MRAETGTGTNNNGNGNGNGNGRHDPTPPMPGGAAKRSKWPLLVVALLGGHVVILVAVVIVATRDPSFAVAPNYYEQAVAWDQSQAQKRASEKLGWKLEIVAAEEADALSRRGVTVALRDASGAAVGGAKIDVTCFHHARATAPARFTVTTDADGKATHLLSVRHAGFWDFRCKAVAADGHTTFTSTVTQYVDPPVRLAKGLTR